MSDESKLRRLEKMLSTAIKDTGFFKDESLEWIIPIVLNYHDREPPDGIERQIRKQGLPISDEEKKALGFQKRSKVGRKWVEALTEKGKQERGDIRGVLFSIENKLHRIEEREEIKELIDSNIKCKVEISITNDDRNCVAIERFKNKFFEPTNVPELPLKECDAEFCRCVYLFSDFKMPQRVEPKTESPTHKISNSVSFLKKLKNLFGG